MQSAIKRETDGTITLTITIPWENVRKTYDTVVDEIVKKTELSGFRKGKAPRKVVEEKLDKTQVYEDVLKHVLPEVYNAAIVEHKLRPIINPKIELSEATEGKDWIVLVRTCERPKLTIGDYKKAVGELKTSKQKKIWVPGQDPKEKDEKEAAKPTLDEILRAVRSTIDAHIPALLTESQVNKMLSDLIDQTRKLGLTVEQYLSSSGKTSESLRAEYTTQAQESLLLEFAVEDIADREGILVSDDDIEKVLKSAKTPEEKATLEKERYYIASVLRRQKTLDFLASL